MSYLWLMKKIGFVFLGAMVLLSLLLTLSHAQKRNDGKLVVPIGYERYDSIRFDVFGLEFARWVFTNAHANSHRYTNYPWESAMASVNPVVNAYGDSVQATFESDFEDFTDTTIVAGKRKGIYCPMTRLQPGFTAINTAYKSRAFYPSPFGAEDFYFARGNYWRYNDVNFNPVASWHNSTYDTNDISPYCEYPSTHSYVIDTYTTKNYNGTSDTLVHCGDNGRVILGYSDNRRADELLRVHPSIFFHGTKPDTAKTFSVTLDFNIDDRTMDNTLADGRPDSLLPLIVLQVLFKPGVDANYPRGQPILPFVPFKDSSHPKNAGWYKVAESVVNKHIYDSLDWSWKAEDTLQDDLASHSWRFKQLHILLADIPPSMRSLMHVDSNDAEFAEWGQGSGSLTITSAQTPDALVGADPSADQRKAYIEIRILSTYRATVRVRGLDYHDTIVDKFLYRKRIAGTLDSTHSCNPDGSIGGYDDSVAARLAISTPFDGLTREYMMNDTDPNNGLIGPLSVPMLAYLDFMGTKRNLHARWREQDDGRNTLQFRRWRMSFDGECPSLFENQFTFFGGLLGSSGCLVFPEDYVYHTTLDARNIRFPSANDTIVGMIIGRKSKATADQDSLAAYRLYEQETSFFSDYAGKLRGSNRIALWHPNKKRFAIDADLQNWAIIHPRLLSIDTVHHLYHFDRRFGYNGDVNLQRPTTPEEIMASGFVMQAEGIPSFTSAQGLGLGIFGGGSPGMYGVAMRTSATVDSIRLTHGYNVGHEYSWRPPKFQNEWTKADTSDLCGDLPPFYVGYSNTWRASNRLLSRINANYDSTNGRKCMHPYKYLTWLDAYSNSRVQNDHYGYGDSTSKSRAFLKIVKTQRVNPWQRGASGGYIDSVGKFDTPEQSFVEVGMFKDSISRTMINRAAIIVNTRLYPSLRDTEDVNYYNRGLDSLSMCHTIYGHIDVRKIYMKIDTSQLDPVFRSSNYVVRDLWHPEATWLVKAASEFAVYIKPGDAKFLYFEKAVSKSAETQKVGRKGAR